MLKNYIPRSCLWLTALVFLATTIWPKDLPKDTTAAQSAPSAAMKTEQPSEPASTPTTKEKKRTGKHVMKVASEEENDDQPVANKDPKTYELSNMRIMNEYTTLETQPFDRGEHMLISALMGGIGGAVVGGMVGFAGFDKDNSTTTQNNLYLAGGIGAGVGAVSGIVVSFFERGKIEQFAIGKFLMKYSWYGAFGGALLGAGVGFIPYSSSKDYGDIIRYGGYGAAIGLVAGIALFSFDLPDHLKLYTYRQADQNVLMVSLRF